MHFLNCKVKFIMAGCDVTSGGDNVSFVDDNWDKSEPWGTSNQRGITWADDYAWFCLLMRACMKHRTASRSELSMDANTCLSSG